MKQISFFVPGTPQPKKYNRGKSGSWYKSSECKQWEYWIKLHANQHAPEIPLECPIILGFAFTFKKEEKKKDLSNLIKSAEDAMTGIIYKDDCQIVTITAHKKYGEKSGVAITVTPV